MGGFSDISWLSLALVDFALRPVFQWERLFTHNCRCVYIAPLEGDQKASLLQFAALGGIAKRISFVIYLGLAISVFHRCM
ncbi:MAG: hypothetical protein BGP10_06365 [Rhodanobacter sp. 68-29]|nr:MAG: hypothetical protein ABT17_09600 [Rhodanobacter sp. SCN 69-32]OJY55454.1 MAG: hypothetical protein BGP10_06365 [Rhodanobacter sp. 68-29]